jgi:uncharacterized heparinase superfamily protein
VNIDRRPRYPGLAAALVRAAAAEAAANARAVIHGSAPWRFLLRGSLPAGLAVVPDALSEATLEGAQDILRGRFLLRAGTLDVAGRSPFDIATDHAINDELHRFAWLAHLERAGGRTAQHVARALVEDWLDRFSRFHAEVWAPAVLGPRLTAWAAHFKFLIGDHDLIFRSRLLKAMAEQTRHLARTVDEAPPGPARLAAAAALVTMDAALPEGEARTSRAADALRRAIAEAVLPDGGIVTRSPADQAEAFAALLRAGRALADAHRPLPPILPATAEALRARLALLRHGDGRLACFHGAGEGDGHWLAELLAGSPPAEAASAPDWGYARLATWETAVVFDIGGPPAGAFAAGAHAGPLAFELSHGTQRIVVNGGVARRRGAAWIDAARRTAAHATLQVGEADAGALLDGAAARRLGSRLYGGTASGALDSSDAGQWAEGEHDLYAYRFGVRHRRRLFLDATGENLRGEDSLTRAAGRGRLDVALRFPLHPDCRASLAQGGDSVLIVPPLGAPWRFRAGLSGAEERLTLEPALYMGGETVRNTQAIVLRAAAAGTAWSARWAFRRETATGRPRQRLV